MSRWLALAVVLPLTLAATCVPRVRVGLPSAATGLLPVEIATAPGTDLSAVAITLDGTDVRSRFAPGGLGLAGTLEDLPPGTHRLAVFERMLGPLGSWTFVSVDSPGAAPALVGATPAAGASDVASSAWPVFSFSAPPEAIVTEGWGFGVECAGQRLRVRATRLAQRLVVNPRPELPAGSACRVVWRADDGHVAERAFSVAAAGAPATALYDRSDIFSFAPFPDDYWLVEDDTTTSGKRLSVDPPPYDGLLGAVAVGVTDAIYERDGFSPIQPIILAFSDAVDPNGLPFDELASLDPLAPIGLYDVDPASPEFGQRKGFRLELRNDPVAADGTVDHSAFLYPAQTLRAGGHYAIAVTRRVLAAGGGPGRPFGGSDFFLHVRGAVLPGDGDEIVRARESIAPVLEFLKSVPSVPIPREDVALALRFSIRSEIADPSDRVAVKEAALAATPAVLNVTSSQLVSGNDLVLRGTIPLPTYLTRPGTEVTRDALGRPISSSNENVPFVFRIPQDAPTPMPIVIYQHGSPGGPEEVNGNARFLADAGYAVIGIQDYLNRRYGQDSTAQTTQVLIRVTTQGHMPLFHFQTNADMMGLLATIRGAAFHTAYPQIDQGAIFYRGISFGSHHALGFLPFAPEVTAAASLVGAGRFFENSLHQIDFFGVLGQVGSVLPGIRPSTLFVGLAALQNDADRDDPYFMARHLYQEPLAFAGEADLVPPSLLWIEGVTDDIVSNNATRAAAGELGIPQAEPVVESTSFQLHVPTPLAGNLPGGVTAAHFQYLPAATPSCADPPPPQLPQLEGHYCPQIATEARAQILHFFATARTGVAEIVNPLP